MNPEYDSEDVQNCKKLGRQLLAGKVTYEEYAYNVSLTIIAGQKRTEADDRMRACVDAIVDPVRYLDFLREFLEPVDFKPCPKPFLVDFSDAAIEKAQLRFRPQYLRLYEQVKNKGWEES